MNKYCNRVGQTFYLIGKERDQFLIYKCFITKVKKYNLDKDIYYSINKEDHYIAKESYINKVSFSSKKKAIHSAKLRLNEIRPPRIETYCLGVGSMLKCNNCLHLDNWESINDYGNGWFEKRRDEAIRIDDSNCQLTSGKLFKSKI